jgi:hypothetical protein
VLQFSRRQCDDNSELTTAASEPAQDFSGQGSLTIKDALLIGCNGVRRRGLGRYRICDVLAPGSPPLSSYPGRVAFNRPRSDRRTSVGGRPLVLSPGCLRGWYLWRDYGVSISSPMSNVRSRGPAIPHSRPSATLTRERNQHKQTVSKDKD